MDLGTLFSRWGITVISLLVIIFILARYILKGKEEYLNIKQSLDDAYGKLKELSEKVVPVYDELGPDDQVVSGTKGVYNEIHQILVGTVLESDLKNIDKFAWGANKGASAESPIFITKSVYEICDSADFCENRLFSNWVKSAPAMATGLGLLGTFVGLTYGLMQANTSDKTNEIIGGVKQMLSGSGAAFATSLVGIAISLGLTYLMNQRKDEIDTKYLSILDILDQLIPVKSYEVLVAEQVSIAKEEKEDLKQVFESMVENLCHGMSDVYKTDLLPYFDRMETNMGNITNKLDFVNESLNRISQSAGNAVGEAVANVASNEIKELSKIISAVKITVEASGASAKAAAERQAEVFNNMKNHMESGNQAMEATTNTIIEKMQHMSNAMMDQTKAMTAVIKEQTEKSTTDMTEKLAEAASQIASSMQKNTENMSGSVKNITDEMVKVSNDVLAKINESQNVLVTRVENMATNMDKVTENLTKSSTGMFKEITDIVKSLINEIEGSMKSVEQIAGEVESTMKAVSNGHKVLDDATKALKATIDEVQKYQSDYINRMVEISTRVERVSRLTSMSASKMVEHFQKYKEEYLNLAREMHTTMNEASDRIESMQEQLGKSALQVQENMQSKLTDINKATEEVLRVFDQHTTSLCAEFNSVVQAMGDTSESFIAQMNKLSADKARGRRE